MEMGKKKRIPISIINSYHHPHIGVYPIVFSHYSIYGRMGIHIIAIHSPDRSDQVRLKIKNERIYTQMLNQMSVKGGLCPSPDTFYLSYE